MVVSSRARAAVLALSLLVLTPAASLSNKPAAVLTNPLPVKEVLDYSVEWRLIRAGSARLRWEAVDGPGVANWRVKVSLESGGLVRKLYPVNNEYTASLSDALCARSLTLFTHEGSKHRETNVTYRTVDQKAYYVERDLEKNNLVAQSSVEIPSCAHDVMGALYRLRTMNVPVGQSVELPVSDGKKSITARVEAQRVETVETPSGRYEAIRYEAFLFRDILYRRDASLYIWLTNDAQRLPVQIRVRMPFYIGTVTLQLEKKQS